MIKFNCSKKISENFEINANLKYKTENSSVCMAKAAAVKLQF